MNKTTEDIEYGRHYVRIIPLHTAATIPEGSELYYDDEIQEFYVLLPKHSILSEKEQDEIFKGTFLE